MRVRLALLAALLTLGACNGGHEADDADGARGKVIVYETRGRVHTLPDPDRPMSDFLVHHEPIPGYKHTFDETAPSGMNAMVMPFPPAEGVSLEGVQVGDVLSLRFEVEYHPENNGVTGMALLAFETLPRDTTLDLGRVREAN